MADEEYHSFKNLWLSGVLFCFNKCIKQINIHKHMQIYEGHLKSSWTRLVILSRKFVEVR
jgi:hypothetical protein